jgi:hypothetical protein
MITARFMGRLGNQMFEYAMAKAQAKRLGVELILDTTLFRPDHPFQLNQWAGVNERSVRGSRVTIREQGMSYNQALVDRIKDGDVLQGYWQSEKYFDAIRDDLRETFFLKLNEEQRELAEQIRLSVSVALHIRRGDYLQEPYKSFHGVLGEDYYQRATSLILEREPAAKFFVFAEDPEWTSQNVKLDNRVIVQPNQEAVDIYLMSKCKHAIIANSTYSWWGAWLGDWRSDRTVVAPMKWFAGGTEDTRDIVPERWVKI